MAGKKNQDPRQTKFLAYYFDPKSETYSDCKNSALKAGYAIEYAENLFHLMPEWVSAAIERRKRILNKAERNLEEILDLDVTDRKIRPALLGIKSDVSKFASERLGKKHYSKRTELTDGDGRPLMLPEEERKKIDAIFAENLALPQG